MKENLEIALLKKMGVIPKWTIGIKNTKGSVWTKKFVDLGYEPTGWRFCDGYGDWWDEYYDSENAKFVYAEQCIRYEEKYISTLASR